MPNPRKQGYSSSSGENEFILKGYINITNVAITMLIFITGYISETYIEIDHNDSIEILVDKLAKIGRIPKTYFDINIDENDIDSIESISNHDVVNMKINSSGHSWLALKNGGWLR